MYRKLSASELSAVVAKIRKKYDEYCEKYFKSSRVKREFENRYMRALKAKVDISNFLLAEISVVEELIKEEEKKIEEASLRQPAKPKTNFADKIIEDNKKRIEKYPSISVHKDCNPEVKKLLGALNDLYENYFQGLHHLLRVMTTHASVRDLSSLENQLRSLGYIGKDRVSSRLTRYYSMLNRFPRDYRAMEREEKDYILESAFFLHDLFDTLMVIQSQNPITDKQQKKDFDRIVNYIEGIISDFRLKDLKKRR